LSGGEQQRLLLAQALVGQPSLLLMDEPLSHLDVRNQGAIVQLIAEVARQRRLTVLLIAHDVNPLLPHIDHVLYIAQGKLAMAGPPTSSPRESLSAIYSAPVEVLRDRLGRLSLSGSRRRSATLMNELTSWNPFDILGQLFHYEFMVHAFEAGTIVAIVAGAIGYFVVLRGSAFAAHALSHIGFAGATAPSCWV